MSEEYEWIGMAVDTDGLGQGESRGDVTQRMKLPGRGWLVRTRLWDTRDRTDAVAMVFVPDPSLVQEDDR